MFTTFYAIGDPFGINLYLFFSSVVSAVLHSFLFLILLKSIHFYVFPLYRDSIHFCPFRASVKFRLFIILWAVTCSF